MGLADLLGAVLLAVQVAELVVELVEGHVMEQGLVDLLLPYSKHTMKPKHYTTNNQFLLLKQLHIYNFFPLQNSFITNTNKQTPF